METPEHDFIGQIRFAKEKDYWVVSISIDKKYRYHHLGESILKSAMTDSKIASFKAFVQTQNEASKKMFLKLNYKFVEQVVINDKEYEVFSYDQ